MPRSERPNMASYGVPVDDPTGLLPWSWAEERLLPNRNYWVTTVDDHGRPHSMPVWGLWHPETERFWFGCSSDAFKLRNIGSHPHVTVAIDDTVEVVSIEGEATVHEPRLDISQATAEKYETGDAVASLTEFMMQNPSIEVRPIKAFGLIERPDEFGSRATRWVWTDH